MGGSVSAQVPGWSREFLLCASSPRTFLFNGQSPRTNFPTPTGTFPRTAPALRERLFGSSPGPSAPRAAPGSAGSSSAPPRSCTRTWRCFRAAVCASHEKKTRQAFGVRGLSQQLLRQSPCGRRNKVLPAAQGPCRFSASSSLAPHSTPNLAQQASDISRVTTAQAKPRKEKSSPVVHEGIRLPQVRGKRLLVQKVNTSCSAFNTPPEGNSLNMSPGK